MSTRAAIYTHVSSLKQGKEDRYSLPDQLEQCRIFAQQHDMEVVFETAEMHSGATLHRPKVEELFERALAGEYEAIIVHEQDRLSREPKDAAYLEVHARLHGIRLYCLDALPKEGDLSETEEFKAELERLFAKWERHKIFFRTSERRKRRAKEGRLIPGSSPLYGYRWDNDKQRAKTAYIVDPQAALVVKRIFAEVAAGRSLREIAKQLTREGILPPSAYRASLGNYPASRKVSLVWRPTMITRIVHTPAYWGEHAAFRREHYKTGVRTQTGKVREQVHQRRRTSPEEGLIPLPEDTCPPLVSKELALAAQAQLKMNKSQAAKSGMSARLALLRGGIAVCGYCGDKMYCMAWRASSAPRYFCRRYKLKPYGQQPECPGRSHSIAHDVLDARVWEYIVMALTIPEALTEALAHHERESAYRQEQSHKRLTTLRTMVQQREAERERFLVTLSEQDDSETRKLISDRLKALAADMKQLRVDIELEERAWQEPNEQREEIKRLVAWGAQKEGELLQASLEEKRNILRWLRVQVKVWRADHQPRYEVWLFAGEDGSPVLLGRGNGQSGPHAHAPMLTGGTPIICRSRSSLAGMDD